MAENTCVCCGEVIPEGRMVCWKCEGRLYWEEMYGNERREENERNLIPGQRR